MKNEERSKINSENAKSPNWSNKEVKYLRDNYSIKSVKEISNNLDRSKKTIYKKAQKENLVSKQMKSNSNIINLNEEIKAYIGGFIDGDGCISLFKNGRYNIFISNTNKHIIYDLKEKLNAGYIERIKHKNPNHRDVYRLNITKKADIIIILENIKRFIKIKNKQANLMLKYLNMYSRKNKNAKKIINEMQNLNEKHTNLRNIGKINNSYIAGLVDSDGCISLSKNNSYKIKITNENKKILNKIKNKINLGYICVDSYNNNGNVSCYCFYISKKEDIINFLESIMPYLIVKKKQAKLMIEYLNNKDENNRNKYISKMKEMNRRGVE